MVKKILKWAACTVVGFILLVAVALTLIVWIMTPARLTPIVARVANDALEAHVGIGRVELTLWHTFPHLTVDIDSLTIVSEAFDSLPVGQKAFVSAESDTLLRVGRFHGAVNVAALLAAKVNLYDIELEGAAVNVVALDSLHANYDIFPATEPADDSTGPVFVPDISLNRFDIVDSLSVSYRSIADSVNIRLVLAKSPLVENAEGGYALSVESMLDIDMPQALVARPVTINLGGAVKWNSDKPMLMSLSDFGLDVGTPSGGSIKSVWNTTLDFTEPLAITELTFEVGPFAPAAAIGLLPEHIRSEIGSIDSGMEIVVTGEFTKPFRPMTDSIPSMALSIKIPRCSVVYDSTVKIDRIEADMDIALPGNIDSMTVTVNALRLGGMGADITVNGVVGSLTTDPAFTGKVTLESRLARLPRQLLAMLPDSTVVGGIVRLDTGMKCRASDFSMANFHRLILDGALYIDDFTFDSPGYGVSCYTRHSEVKLGTSGSFVTANNVKVDSLLTLSMNTDTISAIVDGMTIRLKNAKAGAGCLNRPPSADSTAVIPFGGMLKADIVSYVDTDSSRMSLADIAARFALRRYEHNAHLPQVNVNADAGSIFFTDRKNFMGLRKSHFEVNAHIKPRRVRNREFTAADSARFAARRAGWEAERAMHAGADSIDLSVDESTGRLLRRLQMSGRLTAERGGMFSPYFPLRNRISGFDMEFSTDSVVLRNVRYECGRSDFTINGSVSNIRRALTRGGKLELDWNLHSDSLNVNELVQALYRGADYAAKSDGTAVNVDARSEADLDRMADNASMSADSVSAVLIPMNLDARLNVSADNIVYSDMDMHDFKGELLVSEGALNLHNLHASSEMGRVSLNALYSAPDRKEMRFGMGLDLTGIDIKKFVGMVPAVDSLMPLLNSFEGIIDASIAATADIDTTMNIVMPSLDAAIRLNGRDLVLLDGETFRTLAKWLMFKDKQKNVIEHMEAEMLVRNSMVQLFPFVFDFDRYRLAVMGSNDLDLNFKYHISVLKSPLPFKFGINLSGNPDDMKVRLGGAKYKPGDVGESMAIVANTRVNLLKEIDNVFKRGSRAARLGALKIEGAVPPVTDGREVADTISAADSLVFIKEGLLPAPPPLPANGDDDVAPVDKKSKNKRNKNKKE